MAALNPVIRTFSPSPGFLETIPEEISPHIYQFCEWEDFIALFQTSVNSRISTAHGFAELCHSFQLIHPSELIRMQRLLSPLGITPSLSATKLDICQLTNFHPNKHNRSRQKVCEEITAAIVLLENTNHQIKQINLNYEFLETPTLTRLLACTPLVETVNLHNCVLLQKVALTQLSKVPLRALTFDGSLYLINPQRTPNKQLLHRDILHFAKGSEIHCNEVNKNAVYQPGPFLFSLLDFTGYQNLQKLTFRNVCNLSNDQAIQISPTLSQLKSLTLFNCAPITLPGIHAFLDNPHLTEVFLINQHVDDSALETLTCNASHLQTVELTAVPESLAQPTELGIRYFLNCEKLTDLRIAIGAPKISDETLQELAYKWFATPGAKTLSFRNKENTPARFKEKLGNWRRDYEGVRN